MNEYALQDRLLAAAGERTYRHLSELTRTNAETVRRYMNGHAPSAEYLAAFCDALGINADWLLTGRGPMKRAEVRANALRQADPAELLSAMADTLERLIDRVERLEVFVQTMETRVRARPTALTPRATPIPSAIPVRESAHDGTHTPNHPLNPSLEPAAAQRAARVAGIQLPQPQRPRPNDR